MEEMTCKEIARLIEWLKSKGHTPTKSLLALSISASNENGLAVTPTKATPQAKNQKASRKPYSGCHLDYNPSKALKSREEV